MHHVFKGGELAADERVVIERLLKRPIADDELIDVASLGTTVQRAPEGAERDEAYRRMLDGMREMHKHFEGVPEKELEALIEEAIDHVRHHTE